MYVVGVSTGHPGRGPARPSDARGEDTGTPARPNTLQAGHNYPRPRDVPGLLLGGSNPGAWRAPIPTTAEREGILSLPRRYRSGGPITADPRRGEGVGEGGPAPLSSPPLGCRGDRRLVPPSDKESPGGRGVSGYMPVRPPVKDPRHPRRGGKDTHPLSLSRGRAFLPPRQLQRGRPGWFVFLCEG